MSVALVGCAWMSSQNHGDGGDTSPHVSSASPAELLEYLNRTHLIVGADMTDEAAKQAPYDVRAVYLAGGLLDGEAPCGSCADSSCTAGGQQCSNASGGCAWWGCWQWDQHPPGQYLRDLLSRSRILNQTPVITYYELLQTAGVEEGLPELEAANNRALMVRYYADWRFMLQTIAESGVVALLHIEPDFWAFAEQYDENPHNLPAAVASANPTDCADQEESIAGFGRCMIAMARKYAPRCVVGLHASGWSTRVNVLYNVNPDLDVAGVGTRTGAFLEACGASTGDLVFLDVSDRDAGYYLTVGRNTWWDPDNVQLPHFHQGLAWGKAVAEQVNRPVLWWQLPVGNMALPNTNEHWRDNRVEYFFAHMDEVAAAHGLGVTFGAGAPGQTTPSSDEGYLADKTRGYIFGGGQAPVP